MIGRRFGLEPFPGSSAVSTAWRMRMPEGSGARFRARACILSPSRGDHGLCYGGRRCSKLMVAKAGQQIGRVVSVGPVGEGDGHLEVFVQYGYFLIPA